MNYFNYFTEIEDAFVRRRGKHLLLSPMDWALIESWKEMQIPLHVALRGIERAFDSWEAKPRKRTVKSLLYCQEEVEAQYAEWLASRVGSHHESSAEQDETATASPFSREIVLGHLSRSLDSIQKLSDSREAKDELTEALARAASLLEEIQEDYANAARPDARKLEESLTGVDRMLDEAIRTATTRDQLSSITAEIESQLKPYKRQMDQAAYEQTRANLLRKRLREHFGVPRLSLFYL